MGGVSKVRRSQSARALPVKAQPPGSQGAPWRAALFLVAVFASGCATTAWLLSLIPSVQPGQPPIPASRLAAEGGPLPAQAQQFGKGSRRELYTSTPRPATTLALKPNHTAALAKLRAAAGARRSSRRGVGGRPTAAGGAGVAGARAGARHAAGPAPPPPPAPDPASLPEGRISVPLDFDWRAYLLRFADLRAANVRTRDAAVWHYTERGFLERRSYDRVPILLRYTACQGLFNQMYAHLNALLLAEFLAADLVLPPSVYRESFSKYFSMDNPGANEVKWTPADTGTLLDVRALQAHYARKGMRILPTPPMERFPDCMHPSDAFPRYAQPGVRPEQVVQLGDIYLQSMHVWYLWDRAAERVMAKHSELVDAGWPANTTVVLDLPCPFLSIMTLTCMDAAQEAATALKFNRSIVQMARTIINGMKQAGIPTYNGAHLRLEKDAVDWAKVLGGLPKYLGEYAKSFAAAGFSRDSDLYIASGLLSYNASAEMSNMLDFLRPYSRSVQYKERYLPPDMLSALNPEQEALVDFLVLANADAFVGLGSSTFSVYLREYRVLLGHRRSSDKFIDTSRIGTDALFERCTHFAPLDAGGGGGARGSAARGVVAP